MDKYLQILKKYWNYPAFRPVQDEIIHSIAEGKDTLGLLPTGGGKSITFQVYSLSVEGICIVVTPLIALMKDQVENLKRRGIKALAIYSGMSRGEVKIALDNAVWGDYKFLYISPERLANERFKERLVQMKVNLICIDEAHCISQWGYDFRPSYLKIVEVRKMFPDIPVLALTATATPNVVKDIQKRLDFKEENVLSKSFVRENLTYIVREKEDKLSYIFEVLKSTRGSGIIYVRSRKKTKEISQLLSRERISSTWYHAGLSNEIRGQRQQQWIDDRVRVMVATNAFGMGIDKPDVRFVIHYEAPDSLEAYYQEAGRAGRDGKKAFAVLLYNNSDSVRLKKGIANKFPEEEKIKQVYEALGNFLQVPIGFGMGQTYNFNLIEFATNYRFSIIQAFNSLKILQQEGLIELTDELDRPSMVHFQVQRDELYRFQVANSEYDVFIKLLLRSYTGLFTDYRPIDEKQLATRAKTTYEVIYNFLKHLKSVKIIDYIPRKKTPFIIYVIERQADGDVRLSKDVYQKRKDNYAQKVEKVIQYGESSSTCRSILLVKYFGEPGKKKCGICDVCKSKKNLTIPQRLFDDLSNQIKRILKKEPQLPSQLPVLVRGNVEDVKKVTRWLLDNDKLIYRVDGKLDWKEINEED